MRQTGRHCDDARRGDDRPRHGPAGHRLLNAAHTRRPGHHGVGAAARPERHEGVCARKVLALEAAEAALEARHARPGEVARGAHDNEPPEVHTVRPWRGARDGANGCAAPAQPRARGDSQQGCCEVFACRRPRHDEKLSVVLACLRLANSLLQTGAAQPHRALCPLRSMSNKSNSMKDTQTCCGGAGACDREGGQWHHSKCGPLRGHIQALANGIPNPMQWPTNRRCCLSRVARLRP